MFGSAFYEINETHQLEDCEVKICFIEGGKSYIFDIIFFGCMGYLGKCFKYLQLCRIIEG